MVRSHTDAAFDRPRWTRLLVTPSRENSRAETQRQKMVPKFCASSRSRMSKHIRLRSLQFLSCDNDMHWCGLHSLLGPASCRRQSGFLCCSGPLYTLSREVMAVDHGFCRLFQTLRSAACSHRRIGRFEISDSHGVIL